MSVTFSEWYYRAKETLGLPFYTRTQSYRVVIEARIANDTSDTRTAKLFFPIPQECAGQHIEEESFSHAFDFSHDGRFGNRFAYTRKELLGGSSIDFSATFFVTVSPRRTQSRASAAAVYNLTEKIREAYLGPNPFLESSDALELGTSMLARGNAPDSLARAFNAYVVEHFTYGNPIKGLYSAKDAFEKRIVDCGGFDTALCALCIACGIPARIVSGFWAGHRGHEPMHAWCEIMLPNGRWMPADPSVEHLVRSGRDRTKSGRLGFIGSDRIAFSVGCGIPLEDGTVVDILQYPFLLTQEGLSFKTHYRAEIL